MSGNICNYYNCGVNRRKTGRRLFRFPYNNKKICKEWLINCGNAQLAQLSADKLRGKYICEAHFSEEDYKTTKKFHLKESAVPKKFHYEDENFEASTLQKLIPREIALTQQIRYQTLKIKNFNRRFTNLKKKMKCSQNALFNLMPMTALLYTNAQTFVLMQYKEKHRKMWNKVEQQFGICFFYKSPTAYSFLRRKGIMLPSLPTIRRCIGKIELKRDTMKNQLKLKRATMTLTQD